MLEYLSKYLFCQNKLITKLAKTLDKRFILGNFIGNYAIFIVNFCKIPDQNLGSLNFQL